MGEADIGVSWDFQILTIEEKVSFGKNKDNKLRWLKTEVGKWKRVD